MLSATVDVSNKVELLGSPYNKLYKSGQYVYARNIWDMQVFAGKLFLGAGNSSNGGPASNAGRVPVYSFDPKNDTFKKEYTVAEEQVDRFRVINETLYIPGHDATEKWTFGNIYTRNIEGKWQKYRNIPNALHILDIASLDGKLFLGLGLNNQSAIAISDNMAKSWEVENLGFSYNRIYSFLELNSKLYACKSFTPPQIVKKWPSHKQIDYFSVGEYQKSKGFIARKALTPDIMFPDTYLNRKRSKKIIRSEKLGSKAIYIGAYLHYDIHGLPFGVYVASSLEKNKTEVQKVVLPESYTPWDILVRDKDVYIVCHSVMDYRISVLHAKVDNLKVWKELFSFESMDFSRSFELLDGDFYFGIGAEINSKKNWKQYELSPETGNILRVKKESYILNKVK